MNLRQSEFNLNCGSKKKMGWITAVLEIKFFFIFGRIRSELDIFSR